MTQYKLKKIFLNNFRNVTYNEKYPYTINLSDIPSETRGVYEFDNEKVIVFDGENGYGKTTFFLALEFLFLGKIAKQDMNASEHKGENLTKDFLKNNKSADGTPYFITGFFSDGTNDFTVTRWVQGTTKKLYMDSKEVSEEQLSQKFFPDSNLDINAFYKNFIYLPQDEVFTFITDKDERKGIEGLLNIDTHTKLLAKFEDTARTNTNALINTINSLKIKLSTKKDSIGKEIQEQNTQSTTHIGEKYSAIFEGKNYFDTMDFKALESEERGVGKKLKIDSLLSKYDTLDFLYQNHTSYKHRKLNEYKQEINKQKDFILGGSFSLFLECDNHRNSDTFIYKDISKEIQSTEREIQTLQGLKTNLEDLKKEKSDYFYTQNGSKITQKFIKIDYRELEKIDTEKFLQTYIEGIINSIGSKKEEIEQYGSLQSSVKNIFEKVKNEGFREMEIKIGNKEIFCPSCGLSNGNYEQLKQNIENQLKFFESKSQDTKQILEAIELLISSRNFIDISLKIDGEISKKTKILNEKNIVDKEIKGFQTEELYAKKELRVFIAKNRENFGSKDFQAIFDDYIQSIQEKINEIPQEDMEEVVVADYETKFKSIFGDEKIFDFSFPRYIGNLSEINKMSLQNERIVIENQLKNKELQDKKDKIRYIDARIQVLEQYKLLFTELQQKLNTEIGEYKKSMLAHIKIPVYIFSKRILKSYEGDSIFLDYDTNGKIQIFSGKYARTPYFQYSQGQLTAVMISILLSLNIFISSKSSLNTILIDDPVQTLDDLNELSFANLLRYQFNDKQIIISTHEQEFSSFVRYKFWRLYGDTSHKNINMKDRFLDIE